MTSPTAAAVSGPSGRNQVTVQFIAPSIARATMAGSMSTSSPDADALGDQPAERMLVAIALPDDGGAQRRRQRLDLEVRGRPFDVVEQRAQVRRADEARGVPTADDDERRAAATASSMRSSARSWQ